jgi:hypothetical protein
MAVMARGDIVVGDQPAIPHASAIVENLAERADAPIEKTSPRGNARPTVCGAMSRQRDNSCAQSTPQKFLRLVGSCDPGAKR